MSRTTGPRYRVEPEDFVVEEIPAYAPSGEGSHLFVHVEKRLRTTEEVARDLARAAGVRPRDVGYAGRKDRVAVARQWFSLEAAPGAWLEQAELRGVRILDAVPHAHKLRTGHARGNRFVLRVHGVSPELGEQARRALEDGLERGIPNRFGPQRYGRDGENVARGLAILRGEARGSDKRKARFFVSAAQSAVFDAVLEDRSTSFDTVLAGDVARVEASGGLFVVEDVAVEAERAARFEISATGPIFGTRVIAPEGEVAEREAAAHARVGAPPPAEIVAPRGVRLRGTRRPLRFRPEEATLAVEADAAIVACVLPPGTYASVLLETLFGEALCEGPEREPGV